MRFLPLLGLVFLLVSCGRDRVPAQASFYYWRTTLALSPIERRAMEHMAVKSLRVRLFDVVWDLDKIRPESPLRVVPDTNGYPPILPVVFLRQNIFAKTSDISALANHIIQERDGICQDGKLLCKGLELDCDWSQSSREGFFELAKILRDSLHSRGELLHSTIRLHQFHSPLFAGVPPVDRATLMAYNMGPTDTTDTHQSILDLKELEKWLGSQKPYPVPLDVALPLYSWAIQIRSGRPVDLLQDVSAEELDTLVWLKKTSSRIWTAKEGFFLHGHWVRAGDHLKAESVGAEDLEKAARLIRSHLPPLADREVVYFDLSERTLARYDRLALEHLLSILGAAATGNNQLGVRSVLRL